MESRSASLKGLAVALVLGLLSACGNGSNDGGMSMGTSTGGSGGGTTSGGTSGGTTGGAVIGTTSDAFSVTNLDADIAGLQSDGAAPATRIDSNLVNPWGLAFAAGAPVWVANNGTPTSTLYDGDGMTVHAPFGLPDGANGPANATGIVANATTTDFIVSKAGTSGSAKFIFDGEGGTILGWSPTVDSVNAIVVYTDTAGATYKGLALAKNGSANFLYATDFHNNKVDVFDNTFKKVSGSGSFAFADPKLPAGYAPFGIAALSVGGQTRLYVSYAKQQAPENHDNANGAGLGQIDIYDTSGALQKTLVASGGSVLNAPWGMALAPADFGSVSGDLLVGNFGDGRINAFDASSGAPIATLGDSTHTPIAIDGLWGIAFGNDASGLNQPHNTLFFTAGTNDEADGTYGRIDAGPGPISFKPSVTLSAPTGTLSGTVSLSATATDGVGIKQVQFLANNAAIGTATSAPFSVQWDTTKVADGSVTLTATATDVDGNTGTSSPVTVMVSNAAAPPPATTLTQVQQQIFTPICASCHNGSGTTLPGSQNLTAGNSFSNTVNHASVEKPALLRIKPNDPTNSYLVQKIQGGAGISGAQMPFGCPTTQPCLTPDQINLVLQWVNGGALNN